VETGTQGPIGDFVRSRRQQGNKIDEGTVVSESHKAIDELSAKVQMLLGTRYYRFGRPLPPDVNEAAIRVLQDENAGILNRVDSEVRSSKYDAVLDYIQETSTSIAEALDGAVEYLKNGSPADGQFIRLFPIAPNQKLNDLREGLRTEDGCLHKETAPRTALPPNARKFGVRRRM
jgi:hypothetical protein